MVTKPPTHDSPDLVILISGNGSNLQAINDAIEGGALNARITAVISNEPDAYGLERARNSGIPAHVICHRSYGSRQEFDLELARVVSRLQPDLVILAGFMRILGPGFISRFPNRILNIHPSLLPRYKGTDTHRRVLEAGESEHGASVHLVTEALDSGPVIQQVRVQVLAGDDPETLARRVIEQEHRLYPAAIAKYWSETVRVTGDNIPANPSQESTSK